MKKAVVILISTLFLFACSDSPSKGSGSATKGEARVQALAEWESAGPLAQEVLCDVYNDPDVSEEDLFWQMTQGENKSTNDVAKAKIELMKEKCS